jgi:formyltetrahydrofolate-dependent phosphoribosylglycinamide formyltransferase
MIPAQTARLVVLISGTGSNLQAILNAAQSGALPATVAAVFCNRQEAYGLVRAAQAGVPALFFPKGKDEDRRAYDARLARAVAGYAPDWVILAGWMRVLSQAFLGNFPNRVVNLHPALPGTFAGTHAIERAFSAWQRGEIQQTGVMVHLVPDEGVDDGPVLAHQFVTISAGETLESLEQKIHIVEHRLLVDTISSLIHSSK